MHMSGQTGFNYEVMLSRLHGGLCAFQSLRAHRRQREQEAAPAPTPEPRTTPEPPRAAHRPPVDEQLTGSAEPQAFVTVGGRVVPLFGNMDGLFGAAIAPSAPLQTASPMTPSTEETGPAQTAPAPALAPTVSTLKLPPPTPPPRLGLIYGGHPPTPEPAPTAEPSTAPPRAPSHEPQTPAQAQETASIASLTAMLDARAHAEAQRLEHVHAEHRAILAIVLREHRDELRAQGEAEAARTTQLLREHRDELRAQQEADAARTAQLLREVLAQHRAELASANQSHADRIATEGDPAGLRAALLEQASSQREANEDVAEHISALTAIIADLGQTVGMLAVATAHKAQHNNLPTRPTFTPPSRSEPAAAAPHVPSARSAALPQVDPVGVTASRIEPASSRVEPTAPTSSALPPAAANRDRGPADLSLSHAITHEPAHRRPIYLRLAREAAERAHVQEALEGDMDDDLGTDPVDVSDDPRPRRRLPPCTDLVQHEEQERDHDA
jgi:hypothetical protein